MNHTKEISSHENVIKIIKRSFEEEIRKMLQTIWDVIKSKNEEIDILTRERSLDEEEKVKLISRITELEVHVAILTEEVGRKDEALMNQLDKRGKPQILWEENEKIRSELNTLKHIKMKEDKDYQERIETLTKSKDEAERDLETLKNAQTTYYASFENKFIRALEEKEEIIRNPKKKENDKSVQAKNKKRKFDKTTEEANNKSDLSYDTAMTSSKTYDDMDDMEHEEELNRDDQINHTDFEIPERCPMPGCKSEVKFSNKSLGNLKGHLSRHFSKQIIQNFSFKPRQACPLCLENNKRHLLIHKTGHLYHLGIVHRQIQLYVSEDEKHILKFIK